MKPTTNSSVDGDVVLRGPQPSAAGVFGGARWHRLLSANFMRSGILLLAFGGFLDSFRAQAASFPTTFEPPVPLLAGEQPVQLGSHVVPRIVDWEEDGDLDVLAGTGDGYIWLFRNVGSPSNAVFAAGFKLQTDSSVIRAGTEYTGACLADFDGDGKKDLIVGYGYDHPHLRFYPNISTSNEPRFGAGREVWNADGSPFQLPAYNGSRFDVVDWDGDGRLDIVAGGFDGRLLLFLNGGARTAPRFGDGIPFRYNGVDIQWMYNLHPTVCDVNHDGKYDLIYGLNWGDMGFLINETGNGGVDFSYRRLAAMTGGNAFGPRLRELIQDDCIPSMADLNGDGLLDVLSGGLNGHLYVLYGTCPTPRVLIDRSHEWLFAYDDLSERMLRPLGFEVTLCDASLDGKTKLATFDIVVAHQVGQLFDYSPSEIEVLTQYVQSGGHLLIVANSQCPAAKLAARFGFGLEHHNCVLPLETSESLHGAFGAQETLTPRALSEIVILPTGGERWIADQEGQAIAGRVRVGKGSVVCFGDNGAYWDFTSQRDAQLNVPNVSTTAALFRCLVPQWQPTGKGPYVEWTPAEHELRQRGLLVRYSNPVEGHARPIIDILPQLVESVKRRNQTHAPSDVVTVNIIATDGGGWSGGREIGVQCAGNFGATVAVIAHELTHSWEGALPGLIGEGWATLVGMRVAAEFNYSTSAAAERQYWREVRRAAESSGAVLDFVSDAASSNLFGPCEAKMMDLVESLEADYGTGFMTRFLKITRALKGPASPTIPEVLYYFSLAAGIDLAPRYREWQLTYIPPSPISSEELAYRLAEYDSLIPTLTIRSIEAGQLHIVWNSSTNHLYQPQFSTTLANDDWRNLGPSVRGSGTNSQIIEAGNRGQRFYRILTLP